MKKGTMRLLVMITIISVLAPVPTSAQWSYFDNNADIRALHQQGDVLWVGTNGGIVLLDLLSDEVVGKISAGPSLPSNSVRVIRSHDGDIYVGTDDGLSINPNGETIVRTKNDDAVYTDIRSISWGVTDALYVGTFGHGVGLIEDDEIRHITRADSLLDNKVFAVSAIDTGRVYYATSLGLCAYRDSAWVGFQAGAGLPRGEVRQMIKVGEDRFYLLIEGRGVYRFNHRRSVRIRTGEAFGKGDVGIARYRRGAWTIHGDDDADVARARWRCAYAGPSGSVFFGSADGLLAIVTDGKLRKVFIPSILPSGYIGPIAEGGDGRKYVVNGPYLLSAKAGSDRFELETTVGSVFAIASSPDGQVWVSTPWGLLRREGGRWVEIEPDIEPKVPVFASLVVGPSGSLWAGAHNGQVYRYDGRFWVAYAGAYELAGGPVFRLLIDRHRNVWAFTRAGGVHRYDGVQWRTYPLEDFDSLRIRDGALDSAGLPVAITARGIWRFDIDIGWKRVLARAPTEIGRYRSVSFDMTGRMYLGTTNGLALVGEDGEQFVGARDGLRGRDVTALLIDTDDNLWVGFRDDGISRISLENLW
jgi:ligand-binding sensor domain-containing protein